MCAARQTELRTWHANATLVCAKAKGGDRTHARLNRNAAGRSCNTTWIAFVDADDEMQPERVERMLGHVLRHRADIGLPSHLSFAVSALSDSIRRRRLSASIRRQRRHLPRTACSL